MMVHPGAHQTMLREACAVHPADRRAHPANDSNLLSQRETLRIDRRPAALR